MSEDTSGEKTFEPTEKKKSDSAKKGDVLRSKEVATAAGIATGGFVLLGAGPWLFDGVKRVAFASLRFDHGTLDTFMPGVLFGFAAEVLLPPIFAIGIAVIIITTATQLLLGEGRWVPENMGFKGKRINPLSGLKRIFGVQGLIELGKSILKLVLLGGIAAYWAAASLPEVLGLGRGSLEAQLAYAWDAVTKLVGLLVIGLLIIALIDYPLQRFQRNKRLKMSHKEMRDETKQAEGSPEVKMARRQRQRDLARGSVGKAMKDAQFVLVNPMRFAVALTYDPSLAPAPVVLAKGRGETALAMRELASEAGLPVLQYPQLARAVYFTTRANQMVREELYIAIAALVAFVMSLKRGEHPQMPIVDVPHELRFDAQGKLANSP
ncbi:MAG: flagellar type III secretion system protein FlhB [Pseudomonadota bacterium]